MSRRQIAAAFSVVLTALLMPSLHAQEQGYAPNAGQPLLLPPPITARPATLYKGPELPSPGTYQTVSNPVAAGVPPMPIDANIAQAGGGPAIMQPTHPGYVRLGAPMYPTPRPNIPIWTGSTMITNHALAPQEMLYPHTYRSIYPPFYHRVRGGWIVTPFGVRSHERWELQGTAVQVKYRSSYPGLLSGAFWLPHEDCSPNFRCR